MKAFLEHFLALVESLLVQRPWAVLGSTVGAGLVAGLTLGRAIF